MLSGHPYSLSGILKRGRYFSKKGLMSSIEQGANGIFLFYLTPSKWVNGSSPTHHNISIFDKI
jgi:hypothetical protein